MPPLIPYLSTKMGVSLLRQFSPLMDSCKCNAFSVGKAICLAYGGEVNSRFSASISVFKNN